MHIDARAVTALIGPSGCGKSTLLRCLNRMNDELGNVKVGGSIVLDGTNIYDKADGSGRVLRKRVGQVFQKPNPFPMSIYDNVAYGPRTHGVARGRSRATSSRTPSSARRCGARSRTSSRSTRSSYPVASSSGSASRELSPRSPRSC